MRNRRKDFKGCLRCRERKIKCDQARPHCRRCVRIGQDCPGYLFDLTWVTPNRDFSKAQGRGGPCPYSAWRGWRILTYDEIDAVLTRLDKTPCRMRSGSDSPDALFSCFDIQSVEALPSMQHFLYSPWPGRDWDNGSRYLFHHYVNSVSTQMMPFSGSCNPWKTHYPRLALQSKSVRHALLSQAAAHRFYLDQRNPKMKIRALKHRAAAFRQLRYLLSRTDTRMFEVRLAAILSLIMADVYLGVSDGWRTHVLGAVEIAMSSVSESPWQVSEMAWLTAQSLCLLCLRARVDGTLSKALANSTYDNVDLLHTCLEPVSYRTDYGFTVGASQSLASCLGECAAVMATRNNHTPAASRRVEVERLSQRLLSMTVGESMLESAISSTITSQLNALHTHIFALGLLICLQRRTLNPIPLELSIYTKRLFQAVMVFKSLISITEKGGQRCCGPTIWPVFHAAVELCRPEDQQYAREVWLDEIETFAIGNRKHIRLVLEKVWLVRRERAKLLCTAYFEESGVSIDEEEAAGRIIIDWIVIAEEMGLDVLLV